MPRRTGSAGIFAISIALMVYHTDAADSVTLSELVCDSQIYDIKDGDSLLIKWDGTELPKYCRLGFEAPDTSSWTCFNIEKFRLYNCKFYIEIYKNFEKYSSKRYDCSSTDIDDEYCLQSQKITYLKFTYNHTGIASFSPHVRLSVSVQHKEADAVASPEVSGFNVLPIILILGVVGGGGALIKHKHGLTCLRETLGALWECLNDSVCCIIKAVSCESSRAVQEDTSRNRTEHTDIAITFEPGVTLSRHNSMLSLGILASVIPNNSNNRSRANDNATEDTSRNRTEEPFLPSSDTESYTTLSEDNSLLSLDIDDGFTEEPLDPSTPPTDNIYDPPSYVVPLPDSIAAPRTLAVNDIVDPPPYVAPPSPEEPPPSYYDVVTMNK
ncbi:uncharacterized protein LOC117330863 isoform X1 [Pecten maximus]|uniref:uncharacterized protein LOC117330863 isoform X1 n=1 Tax=Pecten maximus TaxID=6579 RepID=UPI001458CC71|nr:uncharacterized protein LOC117330863 isoform X1 [Pecten maximus]